MTFKPSHLAAILLSISIFSACSNPEAPIEKTPVEKTPVEISPIETPPVAKSTLDIIKEKRITFDDKGKPIGEAHLAPIPMITFRGITFSSYSTFGAYTETFEKRGFEGYAQFVFDEGLSSRARLLGYAKCNDLRCFRFGGHMSPTYFISTTSALEIAARFTKHFDGHNRLTSESRVIFVVENPSFTAIDVNKTYDSYGLLHNAWDQQWEEEKEFARLDIIPGKEVVGMYPITQNGKVLPFMKNPKNAVNWSPLSEQEVQATWDSITKRD